MKYICNKEKTVHFDDASKYRKFMHTLLADRFFYISLLIKTKNVEKSPKIHFGIRFDVCPLCVFLSLHIKIFVLNMKGTRVSE